MSVATITFSSGTGSYPIHIGSGLLSDIGSLVTLDAYTHVHVVTDINLEKLWLQSLRQHLGMALSVTVLSPGEEAKTIGGVEQIWKDMLQAECDRQSLVISFGGGVVGDMAGFAASTYMRGVDILHIPTSLLAQIDSSVGGKTGCNLDGIKNLIGTFRQPIGVIIDTDLLSTLPKRELHSAFGEMIKHGLIYDSAYFETLAKLKPSDLSTEHLADLIYYSCQIKAAVAADDERESGRRKILNFGHTIGHAVESLSHEMGKPLLHGEAISIGMVVEAELSKKAGLATTQATRINSALKHWELPTFCPPLDIDKLIAKLKNDKKNSAGIIKLTLLRDIGSPVWDIQVPESLIRKIIIRNQAHISS